MPKSMSSKASLSRGVPHAFRSRYNGGWSALGNKPKKFVCFDLLHITEQAPDPNNRIKLSGDRDAFGLPKIVIQWRYNDIDKRSAKRATQIFAALPTAW